MHKHDIFDQLRKLAISKGQEVTEERLHIYTEFLSKYDHADVMQALLKCFKEVKFFPDISEIIKAIEEPIDIETEAQIMAGEILDAAKSFGQYQANEAKEALGSKAWYSVERFGGWDTVCGLKYSELNTSRAQLKNICKASIKLKNIDSKQIENHGKRGLTRLNELMGENLKQLESKNE